LVYASKVVESMAVRDFLDKSCSGNTTILIHSILFLASNIDL